MKKPFVRTLPSSLYRLQLSENFNLKQASALIPYFLELGIEGIYCSPIFDSLDGYDVMDPNQINPVLGTKEEFEQWCALLQKKGLKQILDIVPNHMGIKGRKNHWWIDLLAKGKNSPFASFFDINWNSEKESLKGKVLLPILNESYAEALESQKISLMWDGGFWLVYRDYYLPIAPSTYYFLWTSSELEGASEDKKEWLEGATLTKKMISCPDEGKKELTVRAKQSKSFSELIQRLIAQFNGKKGDAQSFDRLDALLEQQYYRLAYWRVADQEINYRRFFYINDLIALHMENADVLNTHHHWIFALLEEKKIQGLRIDHPDGLYSPAQYFEKIQTKKPSLVVIEKILDYREKLPAKWQVDGTVGYEFINVLNGLFIQKNHEQALTKIYEEFVAEKIDFFVLLHERKRNVISKHMASELHFLTHLLEQLAHLIRYERDFTRQELTEALEEVMACFPVYRTYVQPDEKISGADRKYITLAIRRAIDQAPKIPREIFRFIHNLLLMETTLEGEDKKIAWDFLLRFQQLTPTMMAKSLEDSTYYLYNRLISLNEVGGHPHHFGFSKEEFHHFNQDKRKAWPLGLLPLSTHDTKFSNDARCRIDVLSEIPDKWRHQVSLWKTQNEKYKTLIAGILFPDLNTEYLIYQMLLGLWPLSPDEAHSIAFAERLSRSLRKAVREAGTYTNWEDPNILYEKAVNTFLDRLITPSETNLFYPSFIEFQNEISLYGKWNSLSAIFLQITSCGITDIYQGDEWFTYSYMDPDNRRAVDYKLREEAFSKLLLKTSTTLHAREQFVKELFKKGSNGEMKLFLMATSLQFRKQEKELFLEGEYLPLEAHQGKEDHLIAFMRKHKERSAVIVTTRFFTQLVKGKMETPVGEKYWGAAQIALPKTFPCRELIDIFTGKTIQIHRNKDQTWLDVREALGTLPFCLLTDRIAPLI